MTKPIDAEVHLAMYQASKEAPNAGGWNWSKAFAKALYTIAPPVIERMASLRARVKQLEGEAEESQTDYNYIKACLEEEKRRRQASETEVFDAFVAGVLSASGWSVDEARDLGRQYVDLLKANAEGKQ